MLTKDVGKRIGKKGIVIASGKLKPENLGATERKPARLQSKLTHAAGIGAAASLGYIVGNIPGTAFHKLHLKSKENKMHEKMLPK